MKTTLVFFAILAGVCSAQGNVANGKNVFVKNGCAACHGTTGHGGAGARLTPNPSATAAFIAYVRKPAGNMPPYTNQVTDAELTDIRAYLATIPAPPAIKDIPLLNQ
jgi:mono/diheme cytochrome c family protein